MVLRGVQKSADSTRLAATISDKTKDTPAPPLEPSALPGGEGVFARGVGVQALAFSAVPVPPVPEVVAAVSPVPVAGQVVVLVVAVSVIHPLGFVAFL